MLPGAVPGSKRGVLVAPITVKDQPADRAATDGDGHVQRGTHQIGTVVGVHHVL